MPVTSSSRLHESPVAPADVLGTPSFLPAPAGLVLAPTTRTVTIIYMQFHALLLVCALEATHATGGEQQQCAFWCTRGSASSHCGHSDCAACDICASRVACEPTSRDDLAHESCEPWCNGLHGATHCPSCACRKCSFCAAASTAAVVGGSAAGTSIAAAKAIPAAPVLVAEPTACEATANDDGSAVACKSYCQARHASAHCPRCDCKGCDFCVHPVSASPAAAAPAAPAPAAPKGPVCTPFSKDDLNYEACATWCKAEHRGTHCNSCACRACAFCGGAEAPGDADHALAAIKSGSLLGTKTCEPTSRDDGKVEHCKSYCLDRFASSHCTRCDCKACSFCSSRHACTPHDAHDSTIESCEGACSEQHATAHCPLCRCKKCGFCQAGGQQVAVACEPLDEKDVSYATCERFCNANHVQSHCPLCRCRQCSFCQSGASQDATHAQSLASAAPPPPPDPSCAALVKSGAWADGIIVQVRMKAWESKSLVRFDWADGVGIGGEGAGGAPEVRNVNGATLVQRTKLGATGGSLSFSLGDAARAASVGQHLKAFEIQLAGLHDDLPPPSRITCHYQMRSCGAAKFQLVEDLGGSFRAEVLLDRWQSGGQVRLTFADAAVELKDIWQATALAADPTTPGVLDFVLDASPDGDGGFGFTATGLGVTPPSITCTLETGTTPTRTLPDAQRLAEKRDQATPPQPPRVRSSECGEFHLDWDVTDSTTGNEEWAIFYKPPEVGAFRHLASNIRGSAYAASGLPAQTPLVFYLRRGSEANGWSGLSGPSETVQSALGAVPAKPVGLGLGALPALETSVSCASLTLVWAASSGCAIEQYSVQARKPSDSKWVSSSAGLADGASTSYSGFDSADDVGSLCHAAAAQPGASLEVRLQARSTAGWSGFSSSITIKLGASETPSHTSAPHLSTAATCSAATIGWANADTHGLPASMHRVEWRPVAASAQAAWQSMQVDAIKSSATIEPIDGGIAYHVRVATQSVLGWGSPSPPIEVTAPRTTSALTPPQPPTRLPSPAGRCDTILLQLPPARRGCEHDDALILQIRSFPSPWQDLQAVDQSVPTAPTSSLGAASAAEGDVSDALTAAGGGAMAAGGDDRNVLIASLEPYTAYQFRLVARRAEQLSAPGEPTPMVMPGEGAERIGGAPTVEATSSASYRVSWGTNGAAVCRPQLRWDLMQMRPARTRAEAMPTAAGMGDARTSFAPAAGEAQMVAVGLVNASSFDALGVRCPLPGCAFRLHAVNLNGFDGPMWTATSALVPTNMPPLLPFGAARFEARLAEGAWKGLITSCRLPRPELCESNGDAAAFVQAIGTQKACSRGTPTSHCSTERLAVREIYGGGRRVVFDLLPAGYGTSTPPPRADVDALVSAARQLPIDELLSLPPPSTSGDDLVSQPVTLYHIGGSGDGFSTAGLALAILGPSILILIIAVAIGLYVRARHGSSKHRRTRGGGRGHGGGQGHGGGGREAEALAQLEDDFLDDMDDVDDEMDPNMDRSIEDEEGSYPSAYRHVDTSMPMEAMTTRTPAPIAPHMAPPPTAPRRAPPLAGPQPVYTMDLDDEPPLAAGAPPATMAVLVTLEGDEEHSLDVPMSAIVDTESMLRAAFDACAETVGMELEANDSKQIVLRYVTPSGKEKRLNTKVPWTDLRQARAIIIRLQSMAGRGGTRS